MTPQFVYTMKGLGAALPPGRPAFRDLWLSLPAGARLGVIGPAGAGKTTLLRIMAGELTDFEGEAGPAAGVTVGYLPPAPRLDDAGTVAAAVEAGVAHLRALLREYDEVMAVLSSGPIDYGPPSEAQSRLHQALDAAGAWRLDGRVASLTDALRLPPGRTPIDTLTAAERRRVALCRLLLQAPDLLLLDEPADDLDAELADWIDRHLAGYSGTVVAASRDRCFLDGVADWILALDGGAATAWRGGYASWLEQQGRQLDAAAATAADRRRAVQREIDWMRTPPRVRAAGARARLQDRAGEGAAPAVVEAQGVVKGYGARALIGGLSFALPPGAVAGVLGPGGAGKTTLLRLIAGEAAPDAGAVRLGTDVRVAVLERPGGEPRTDPAARLAALQREGVNLVLLDEPERGLDVAALRVLEDALLAFAGSAVVATGDRRLLDRVATHILAFEGDSRVEWFPGVYAAYQDDRRRRLGCTADQPHRIRFRRLRRG